MQLFRIRGVRGFGTAPEHLSESHGRRAALVKTLSTAGVGVARGAAHLGG